MKKNLYVLITLLSGFLASQTDDQIKQAKKMFEKSGLTEQQAKSIAKERGYSNKQINDAIKKSKELNKKKNIEAVENNLNENSPIELGETNNQLDNYLENPEAKSGSFFMKF